MSVRPIPMEFNNIRVFQLRKILEYQLYFLLLRFEVFPLGELHFVPNNLHTFLCIHSQVGAVDSRYISLLHLSNKYSSYRRFTLFKQLTVASECLDRWHGTQKVSPIYIYNLQVYTLFIYNIQKLHRTKVKPGY